MFNDCYSVLILLNELLGYVCVGNDEEDSQKYYELHDVVIIETKLSEERKKQPTKAQVKMQLNEIAVQ